MIGATLIGSRKEENRKGKEEEEENLESESTLRHT
jgi:hypothetical protein